jgi:hypothetical protein
VNGKGQFRMMGNFLRWWLFAGIACVGAAACSSSSSRTAIGRSFLVNVSDRGRPVVGLQIELTTEGKKKDHAVAIFKTDAKGSVQFENVRAGRYFVGIKQPAFGYSEEIRVMQHPPKESAKGLAFEWPGWKPLSTTTVSGSITGVARTDRGLLLDTTAPIYSSVVGAKLTLMNALSDKPVEMQISSDAGRFEFHAVPAGLYLLRVETPVSQPPRWRYPNDGYVPIEVDPRSKFGTLDVVLDNAICGELAWGRRGETDSLNAKTH